jgi:CRISPR-associated protein Cst2
MSKHLFGAVVTSHGVGANNRGEGEGNTTTLQKLMWNGDVHTTVSAEAIRWALRSDWQRRGIPVNREWDEATRQHSWQDQDFVKEGRPFIDDDVLGYMSAQAAKEEAGGDAPSDSTGTRGRKRGKTLSRRSRFEATRAISLSPWTGDVVFNVAGIGATPSAATKGAFPVPYSAEVHATRYQYAFALTPEHLYDQSRATALIDAIVDLTEVAGNHARYLYDFSPDAVIFRWTDDFAPRILYPFRLDEHGCLSVPDVVRRARAGDIEAGELVIGGSLEDTDDGRVLKQLGAKVYPGVKKAAQVVRRRLGLTGDGE